MSETAPPAARVSRPLWPGLVWAIPLSALIVVLFLGVRAFVNRGVDVVISFDTAAGVKVGDTKVLYQGYEVGRVVRIDVSRDIHSIDLTVRLDPRAKPVLRDKTVFWLVGSKTSLDISSVKAAFSGASIGVAPSFEGRPTRRFKGLSDEPVIPPDAAGSAFVLSAERLGSVRRRSAITYRGQEVGRVVSTSLLGDGTFRVDVFVFKPYDRLVRPGAAFWPAAAVRLAVGAGGVSAQLDDPAALLSGGLQMGVPPGAPMTPSPAGSHFIMYNDAGEAQAGPPGPRVPYALAFPGAGGDLAEGAPVMLLGFAVGEVTSRSLAYDPRGEPYTRVIVGLEPARLRGRDLPEAQDAASLRATADAALSGLLARGYRAKLSQTPPLVGARAITLDRVRGAGAAALGGGDPPLIPSLAGSGDISDEASTLLAKIDRVPIERIGQDVAAATRRVRTLMASPKIDDSLDHLHATLAQVDRITAEAEPQVGPLVAKLREAAEEASGAAGAARGMLAGDGANPDASLPHAVQELSDAAASIRALADQLSRHPESLLKGRGGRTR